MPKKICLSRLLSELGTQFRVRLWRHHLWDLNELFLAGAVELELLSADVESWARSTSCNWATVLVPPQVRTATGLRGQLGLMLAQPGIDHLLHLLHLR